MAYLSSYHLQAGPIQLEAYGPGEAYVGLIPSKLEAAGLEASNKITTKPEVARDLGKILVAGFIAEQIASESDKSLTPNPACAKPDHELTVQQLTGAGLSRKYDKLESEARAELEANWVVVKELAEWLFQKRTAEYTEINDFISARILHR